MSAPDLNREEEIAELDRWVKSLETPERFAEAFIDTARARGARIKKGRPTEAVLRRMLMQLYVERGL
jgi:hypothetical protein